MNTEENDITIGPLKLLGLFFMLVAICGVFFAIGYSLGKTSAHEQALNDKGPMSASVSAPVVGNPNAAKPSAGVAAKTERENNAGSEAASDSSAPDLTFFNAVKRSDRNAPATSADGKTPAKSEKAATPVAKSDAAPAPVEVAAKTAPTTELAPAVTPAASGGFSRRIAQKELQRLRGQQYSGARQVLPRAGGPVFDNAGCRGHEGAADGRGVQPNREKELGVVRLRPA